MRVEWVRKPVEIVGDDAQQVRPGVGHLSGETVPVLNTEAGLERVVVEVGFVFFLVDVCVPRVLPVQVSVFCAGRNLLAIPEGVRRICADGSGIEVEQAAAC